MSRQKTKYIGNKRYFYEELDSTNTTAKVLGKQNEEEGTLVIADKQLSGKGRNGRNWQSPAGVGIWMSILLRPKLSLQQVPQLTLVAGLAMCQTIKSQTGLQASIKWPNDIVVKGKKVCGILCEVQTQAEEVSFTVVGIGVNVNTTQFPEELPFASSLYKEAGRTFDRQQLIDTFCQVFEEYYEVFKVEKNLAFMKKEYEANCITLNNKVKIIDNQQSYEAYAQGITCEGALIVNKIDGKSMTLVAGEVSVRGVYGYCD